MLPSHGFLYFCENLKNMKLFSTLAITLIFPILLSAQSANMDKVFILGEEEQLYEQLTSSYSQSLLEAASGDIEVAFDNWLNMQQAMDAYAEQIGYNLDGVKVWLHVFFGADGQIDHLGFLLRPDSRLVDQVELRAFFAGFVGDYQLPLRSSLQFNHYTGAAFPTISRRVTN